MIEISELTVRFGALTAVDRLSLSVPQGALFGLLGPNGAGKTTTLACVAALRAPDSGTIRVGDVDVVARPGDVAPLVGLVPQHLAIYPTLTVLQNLRFFAGIHQVPADALDGRVQWALALAQLEGREGARVETLSGGMQRRLNLVCGLLHDPPLIICDEPTTGVDPQSRNHLFDTIRRLNDEGRTVVYTTHYMEEVEALCDTVAIVDRGRLIACDALPALLKGALTPRVEVSVEGEAAEDVEAKVRAALSAAGLEAQVNLQERTLEQVFLDLTGRALRDED